MKKVLFTMMGVAAFALTSKAQIELAAQGSYLAGTGSNSNVKLWGGGVHAKFFLGKNLAIGAIIRAYPKTSAQNTVGAVSYTISNVVTNYAATLDYSLSKNDNAIQPYIGVDAGINAGNQIVKYNNSSTTAQSIENTNKQSHFLLAPKVGLNIGLGKTFGIFGQAQYNFAFGDNASNTTSVSGIPNPITTTPVSKFFTLDAGIYVRLVGANKAK
jgi:hypothetical protein